MSLRTKSMFSYFLCHCLVFLHSSGVRIGSTSLLRTFFQTKIFSKSNFCTHYNVRFRTILTESLNFRNSSRIKVTSPSNVLLKLWIWVFLNIMLCYYFYLEAVLQGMAKNNPTEKEINAEIQATLKHAPAWKLTEEKMHSLLLKIVMIDLNYKLQLLA